MTKQSLLRLVSGTVEHELIIDYLHFRKLYLKKKLNLNQILDLQIDLNICIEFFC
jgi:hypothetical protein